MTVGGIGIGMEQKTWTYLRVALGAKLDGAGCESEVFAFFQSPSHASPQCLCHEQGVLRRSSIEFAAPSQPTVGMTLTSHECEISYYNTVGPKLQKQQGKLRGSL